MVIKPEYKNGIPQITFKIYDEDYFDRHLVHEVIEKWADERPKEIALISADTGQKFTWEQVNNAATSIAYKLLDMGIKKGDFVATSLPFFPEHIFLEYACFKIGAVIVPLDLRLKPTEIIKCIEKVKARVYAHLGETDRANFQTLAEVVRDNVDCVEWFVQFSHPDKLMEKTTDAEIVCAWQFAKESMELKEAVDAGKKEDLIDKYKEVHKNIQETDGCMVIYTTGSTGFPKPALLSHRGITVQNLCLGWGFKMNSDKDTMLVNLPPSHVGGQSEQLMTPWYFGSKCVVLDIFKPDLSLEAIQKYKVTTFGQIPALFNLEWRLPNYNTYDLSSLKFALYGGQAVSRPFLEKLKLMAPRFGTGLGLTELSGFCTYTPLDGTVDDILAGIGYDMPITPISIRAPMKEDGNAGEELKKGEIGNICFSGPQVFLGYVNDEDNTKKTISNDGWCYTGDLGSYDDDGLHLEGRKKLVIKPKGYQVFPGEVEDFAINKFKERAENVGVIGMKHEVFSEAIILFIEKKKGKEISVEEVNEAFKDIAAYKRPEHVVILDYNDMPLNRVQKTDYQALQNMAKIEVDKLRKNGGWDQA
ncbi:MAG: AMP-binding protein [Candidatus Lokiarchaeota archaeon]|nr:AMP-binding protein [Candidatus Lokiarchaeota archaeon]